MEQSTTRFVEDILRTQSDLTLATLREDGYPQANTVSYASDGVTIYFCTGRDSGKVHNLARCSKASVTIDTPYSSWQDIRALSMGGTAEVLPDDSPDSRHAMDLLVAKFPGVVHMSPPPEPASIVFVRFVPDVISVLDYRKGFGHTELIQLDGSESRVGRYLRPAEPTV